MTSEKFRKVFLDCFYAGPPELPPDERYFHDDLPQMTGSELQRELNRALHRLMLDERPSEWLLERIDRLREAINHADAG